MLLAIKIRRILSRCRSKLRLLESGPTPRGRKESNKKTNSTQHFKDMLPENSCCLWISGYRNRKGHVGWERNIRFHKSFPIIMSTRMGNHERSWEETMKGKTLQGFDTSQMRYCPSKQRRVLSGRKKTFELSQAIKEQYEGKQHREQRYHQLSLQRRQDGWQSKHGG